MVMLDHVKKDYEFMKNKPHFYNSRGWIEHDFFVVLSFLMLIYKYVYMYIYTHIYNIYKI